MIKKLLNMTLLTLSIIAITIASFSYTTYAESNPNINVKIIYDCTDYSYILDREYYSTGYQSRDSMPLFYTISQSSDIDYTDYFLPFTQDIEIEYKSFSQPSDPINYNPSFSEYLYQTFILHNFDYGSVERTHNAAWGNTYNYTKSDMFWRGEQLIDIGYGSIFAEPIYLHGSLYYFIVCSRSITNSIYYNSDSLYLHIKRFDFSKRNLFYKDTNTNVTEDGYITSYLIINKSYYIYDTNMQVKIADYDNNSYLYYLSFNSNDNAFISFGLTQNTNVSPNPDISHVTNNSSILNTNLNSNDYISILNNISNYISEIDSNTITLIDLLEDLQVNEINNIYNDIVNNYNINIDTEINNYLDNLKININALDITNPKFQIPSNLNNQFTGLKDTFSNIFTILDDNNASIFYIVPIVALIIGALI